MPLARARSATILPTTFDAAILPPPLICARTSLSSELAETIVCAAESSITCARICREERCTHRRGRSAVPTMRLRMRTWTRWRCASRESFRIEIATLLLPRNRLRRRLGSGLAGLLLQPLAGNANAFLLVRVGRTQRAKIRRDLPDLILVRAGDGQMRLLFDGDLYAFGNRKFHRVRIPECEDDVLALHFGAVADAHDIELLLESLGDPRNGVGDQHAVLLLKTNSARQRDRKLALGALHVHGALLDLDFYGRGHRDNFVSNSRHRLEPFLA